jgi:hypothetical protein
MGSLVGSFVGNFVGDFEGLNVGGTEEVEIHKKHTIKKIISNNL